MKRTPLKRSIKPIRKVSAKRAKEMKQYAVLREKFMKHRPMCEAFLLLNGYTEDEIINIQANAVISLWEGREPLTTPARKNEEMILLGLPQKCPRSFDLHHKMRRGKYYLDESTWLACSRQIHQLIHSAPKWAREAGLLA